LTGTSFGSTSLLFKFIKDNNARAKQFSSAAGNDFVNEISLADNGQTGQVGVSRDQHQSNALPGYHLGRRFKIA
jgi:hypothetical protein